MILLKIKYLLLKTPLNIEMVLGGTYEINLYPYVRLNNGNTYENILE